VANHTAPVKQWRHPISIKGKLSIENINLKFVSARNFSFIAQNINLEQDRGDIKFNLITYSPDKGLNLRGDIDNFCIKISEKNICFTVYFQPGNKLFPNKFEINLKIDEGIDLSLEGFLKYQSNNLVINIENGFLYLDLLTLSKNRKSETQESKNLDLSKLKISLPSLPFDLYLVIKRFQINHNLKIPYAVFKPIILRDIRLIYKQDKYLFYAPICYTDLIATSNEEGDIQISWAGLNVAISSIIGCFIEDITNNYLRKIFFNGKLNFDLNIIIPKGFLKNAFGFYEIALQNGFFLIKKEEKTDDFIERFLNLSLYILNLFGLDLPTFRYSLYTAGSLFTKKSKFILYNNLYVFVLSPMPIRIGALILGEISPNLTTRIFKIKGSTYIPLKGEIKIRRINRF
jgi:hypothetical protein